MPNRIKNHLTELGGATASIVGAITASQEQFTFLLNSCVSVLAGVAGCLSIYSFLSNRRKNAKAVKALMATLDNKGTSPEQKDKNLETLNKILTNETINPED